MAKLRGGAAKGKSSSRGNYSYRGGYRSSYRGSYNYKGESYKKE